MIASVDIVVKKAQVLTQIVAVEEGELMGEIMKKEGKPQQQQQKETYKHNYSKIKNNTKKEEDSRGSKKQRDEYYSQEEENQQMPRPLVQEEEIEVRRSVDKEKIRKLEEELKEAKKTGEE